ncbi:GxxExxY protein [Chryseobacterium taklimakanense]|uniref:GxxExxY protein n=1 Tax=Chryseobacterium taklimakanense TaxID=536441 RepID=UPI001EF5D0B5|nr:GxxExxY protein [Chryseobacterium taklimakanense]MCG7281122.1 GxxExxY protein [Chryseobacterium taklimakanense]
MTENEISRVIYDCGLTVHKELGPGLLESAYEECLFYELSKTDLLVERQKPMPLKYQEIKMDVGYRVDLIIENKVIIEVKACEDLANVHLSQILTYLKLSGCKLGMLINFNTFLFKDGVRRVINGKL